MILKNIHSQDSLFKITPKKSGETGINLSNELREMIAPDVAKGENKSVYARVRPMVGRMTSKGYKKKIICMKMGTKVCSGSKKSPSAVVVSVQVRKMNVKEKKADIQLSIA